MTAGGADRDRTDNLLDATEALSQLSYGPAGFHGLPWVGECIDRQAARLEPPFEGFRVDGDQLQEAQIPDRVSSWF